MVRRVTHEPAFVLHRHDWSETSLIIEVLSRHHGRVALVAKGAKRPSSNFRPVLLPLQPLSLNWSGDGEIHTLKSAEWTGGQVMPSGDHLLSGYYLNELLMRLLARDDPHERLFDSYAMVVSFLARGQSELSEPALRAFELVLLREIGLLPALDSETATLAPLQDGVRYTLQPEGGLRSARGDEMHALTAAQWLALQAALDGEVALVETMRAGAAVNAELKPQLRALLHYHCGVPVLRTRQMLMDIRSL